MIQVQNGKFFYNWLRISEADYPSYESVRPGFDEYWEKFCEFVGRRSEEADIQPNQWEVIYVNHIPQDTVWNQLSELPSVLTFLQRPDLDYSNISPDVIGGEWGFEIRPQKGRLYIRLGMKVSKADSVPYVAMTLIARGHVGQGTLDEGLELGHQTITDAFDQITTPSAKKFWGVQNAAE